MYAIEIEGLSKKFDNFTLDNINIRLPKGYIMGYVGQNGAGKTTTIKLITEQFKHNIGKIKVLGKEYKENPSEYKQSIGFVSDDFYFPNDFTINIIEKVLIDFYPSFNVDKFSQFIEKWQLPRDKKVMEFSKGMKIRLMFSSVLSRDTKVLILDEATSGLDPVVRQEILEILQDYIKDGEKSVLFSTHIMDDLEKIADFVCFIDKGKIILNAMKDEILESFTIIKGEEKDLSKSLSEKVIGMTSTSVGFEALISSEDLNLTNSNLIIERPTIDKIVIFHIQGKRRR